MRSPQSSLLEAERAQLSQLFLIRDALIEVVHPPSHPQWIFKVPPALSPPRWVQWHPQLPASTRTWQRFCRSAPKAWICVSCWKTTQKSGSPCNTHPAMGPPSAPAPQHRATGLQPHLTQPVPSAAFQTEKWERLEKKCGG